MEKNVIKKRKFVKTIGIIAVVFFLLLGPYFVITESPVTLLFFFPFVLLGIWLILIYKKEKIVVETDRLVLFRLFRKPKSIFYRDIRCLLTLPMAGQTRMILVGRNDERLFSLYDMLDHCETFLDALDERKIPRINLSEIAGKKRAVAPYLNALTRLERNYCDAVMAETETTKTFSDREDARSKIRQRLKIIGWVLILANGVGYLLGVKPMLVIQILIILTAYWLYLHYYPYIYIETHTKKAQTDALKLPIMGALIAMLFSLFIFRSFSYDFGHFLQIMLCLAIVLFIPYLVKSKRTPLVQPFWRKLSVFLALCFIAFTITFPLNFLLTFEKPTHDVVIVTDKHKSASHRSGTDYYLSAYWQGEETQFNVSKDVYLESDVGDFRRVCIRKSALGLRYYTIHQ